MNVFLLCLLSMTIACRKETKEKVLVRPVRVEKPSHTTIEESQLILPASINEIRETKLSFRVGGPLIVLNDVIGAYVRKGEVIAKLDPRDFKIAVEATQSRYELAKAEYERYTKLVKLESVSKSVYDQMETNYKLAKTDFETASNAFNDAEIKAPFSGYINKVFVNNFEEILPGSPIISLLDVSKFEVNAWISVDDARSISSQTNFTCIVTQGEKEIRIPGIIKEIGNKTSRSKQSLPITVVINSSNEIKLRAGMTTYLEITNDDLQTASSFELPTSSIFTKDNHTYVWIFNEQSSTVTAKQVLTGKVTDKGNIEITKGLSGEESVVIAGAHYLFEGQEVRKMKAVSKSNVGNKL